VGGLQIPDPGGQALTLGVWGAIVPWTPWPSDGCSGSGNRLHRVKHISWFAGP